MPENSIQTTNLTASSRLFAFKLLASVLLINLFIAGLAGIYLYRSHELYESRIAVQSQNLSQSLNLTIAGLIDKTSVAIFSVQREMEKQIKNGAIDSHSLNEYIFDQQKRIPELEGLRIANARGRVVYGDRVVPNSPVSIVDRDYFLHAQHDPKAGLFISKPVFGRMSQKWVFNIVNRINNPGGSFAGIVYGVISLDYLSKIFSSFDLGKNGVITLRDGELAIVIRYPELIGGKSSIGSKTVSHELQTLVLAGQTVGSYKINGSIDPVERIFSFNKVSGYPLYVNVGRATNDYMAPWRKETQMLLLLLAAFSSASLVSAWSIYRNRKRMEIADSELNQYYENLEITVKKRTSELETNNKQLSEEILLRKKIEADSKKSAVIMDRMSDAVVWISNEGKLLYVNDAACSMHGYSRKEMLTMSMNDIAHQFPFEAWQTHWEKLKQRGRLHFETRNIARDSHEFPVEVTANYLSIDGMEYNCAIVRDITVRKRYESELKANENRMAILYDISQHPYSSEQDFLNHTLNQVISLTESKFGYIYFYNELSRQFTLNTWSHDVMRECSVLDQKTIYDLDSTGIWGEAVRQRKPILLNNFQVHHSLKKGYPEGHVDLLRFLTVPIMVDDSIVAVVGVANKAEDYTDTDVMQLKLFMDSVWMITMRKRADDERLKMEKQLLHVQKLESLGVLAGGIAHDFNNILMAIIGNADLALMKLPPESPVTENLHGIEKSAARAADLAKQMLAYSGKGKFIIETIDLNRLLEEMLHMLKVSISKQSVLRLNLTNNLPTVEADATQLRQVFMNLVINASEAIGDKSGVIAITTGCMDCDKHYLKNVWMDDGIAEGKYLYIEISDTGCGMDSETVSKIFDPFFTTKFAGRGLGMAAVLGIIRGHKGSIKVCSEAGNGTSFKLLLPASDRSVEQSVSNEAGDIWRGSGTVLLVDDEETVQATGGKMLRELGFEVLVASEGREAIDVFKASQNISFVLLDLTMPHMDGEQCYRELRQLNPKVRIIMSSGYNEQDVTQRFVGKGLGGFIQKPYKLSELKNVIMELEKNA